MTDTEAVPKTEDTKAANGKAEAAANGDKAENGAAKEEVKNGDSKEKKVEVNPEVLLAQVKRQLEHYFGDYNLPKDKFLKKTVEEAEEGWVSLDIMLKFERLAHLTMDKEILIKALKDSELMETDADKFAIRRLPSLPVPEFNDEYKKAMIAKTVYCKGFEKEKTTLDDLIQFFEKYTGVINVIWRTYPDNKTGERHFKGSSFVTFKDKEAAQKFLDAEEVKTPEGEALIRKWQQEYFDEKDKENEEKRKNRQNLKRENKKARDTLEASAGGDKGEETNKLELPTGAILVLDGFKNADTKREDIKAALKEKYEVNPDDAIAFVYFNKGEKEAKLRFSTENAAKDLSKKISESLKEGEKFSVSGDDLEVRAMEGQEETDFLNKCRADIAQQKGRNRKGHKRHSGRPGYKGPPKRQRQN